MTPAPRLGATARGLIVVPEGNRFPRGDARPRPLRPIVRGRSLRGKGLGGRPGSSGCRFRTRRLESPIARSPIAKNQTPRLFDRLRSIPVKGFRNVNSHGLKSPMTSLCVSGGRSGVKWRSPNRLPDDMRNPPSGDHDPFIVATLDLGRTDRASRRACFEVGRAVWSPRAITRPAASRRRGGSWPSRYSLATGRGRGRSCRRRPWPGG